METKPRIRFELRLSSRHRQALEKLAKKRGKTMSEIVSKMVKNAAQREKVW